MDAVLGLDQVGEVEAIFEIDRFVACLVQGHRFRQRVGVGDKDRDITVAKETNLLLPLPLRIPSRHGENADTLLLQPSLARIDRVQEQAPEQGLPPFLCGGLDMRKGRQSLSGQRMETKVFLAFGGQGPPFGRLALEREVQFLPRSVIDFLFQQGRVRGRLDQADKEEKRILNLAPQLSKQPSLPLVRFDGKSLEIVLLGFRNLQLALGHADESRIQLTPNLLGNGLVSVGLPKILRTEGVKQVLVIGVENFDRVLDVLKGIGQGRSRQRQAKEGSGIGAKQSFGPSGAHSFRILDAMNFVEDDHRLVIQQSSDDFRFLFGIQKLIIEQVDIVSIAEQCFRTIAILLFPVEEMKGLFRAEDLPSLFLPGHESVERRENDQAMGLAGRAQIGKEAIGDESLSRARNGIIGRRHQSIMEVCRTHLEVLQRDHRVLFDDSSESLIVIMPEILVFPALDLLRPLEPALQLPVELVEDRLQ